MKQTTEPSDTGAGRAWPQWIFWVFAAMGLVLLVLEHRAHLLGWWLHAFFGLCVALLYLLSRSGEDDIRKSRPH